MIFFSNVVYMNHDDDDDNHKTHFGSQVVFNSVIFFFLKISPQFF